MHVMSTTPPSPFCLWGTSTMATPTSAVHSSIMSHEYWECAFHRASLFGRPQRRVLELEGAVAEQEQTCRQLQSRPAPLPRQPDTADTYQQTEPLPPPPPDSAAPVAAVQTHRPGSAEHRKRARSDRLKSPRQRDLVAARPQNSGAARGEGAGANLENELQALGIEVADSYDSSEGVEFTDDDRTATNTNLDDTAGSAASLDSAKGEDGRHSQLSVNEVIREEEEEEEEEEGEEERVKEEGGGSVKEEEESVKGRGGEVKEGEGEEHTAEPVDLLQTPAPVDKSTVVNGGDERGNPTSGAVPEGLHSDQPDEPLPTLEGKPLPNQEGESLATPEGKPLPTQEGESLPTPEGGGLSEYLGELSDGSSSSDAISAVSSDSDDLPPFRNTGRSTLAAWQCWWVAWQLLQCRLFMFLQVRLLPTSGPGRQTSRHRIVRATWPSSLRGTRTSPRRCPPTPTMSTSWQSVQVRAGASPSLAIGAGEGGGLPFNGYQCRWGRGLPFNGNQCK